MGSNSLNSPTHLSNLPTLKDQAIIKGGIHLQVILLSQADFNRVNLVEHGSITIKKEIMPNIDISLKGVEQDVWMVQQVLQQVGVLVLGMEEYNSGYINQLNILLEALVNLNQYRVGSEESNNKLINSIK